MSSQHRAEMRHATISSRECGERAKCGASNNAGILLTSCAAAAVGWLKIHAHRDHRHGDSASEPADAPKEANGGSTRRGFRQSVRALLCAVNAALCAPPRVFSASSRSTAASRLAVKRPDCGGARVPHALTGVSVA